MAAEQLSVCIQASKVLRPLGGTLLETYLTLRPRSCTHHRIMLFTTCSVPRQHDATVESKAKTLHGPNLRSSALRFLSRSSVFVVHVVFVCVCVAFPFRACLPSICVYIYIYISPNGSVNIHRQTTRNSQANLHVKCVSS